MPENPPKMHFFKKNVNFSQKSLEVKKNCVPLQSQTTRTGSNAEIAQLVEHNLAKVGVASSSLVFRSKRVSRNADLTFENNQTWYNYICSRPLNEAAFLFLYPPQNLRAFLQEIAVFCGSVLKTHQYVLICIPFRQKIDKTCRNGLVAIISMHICSKQASESEELPGRVGVTVYEVR